DDFTGAFHKVGFAWKLRPQELAILQKLCVWRETEARARNVPRNRLIREPTLWELARKQPQDIAALQRIDDIPARTLRDYSEILLEIIRSGAAGDSSLWPARLYPPLAQSEGPQLKRLKKCVRETAERLDLPVEVL